jgi:DNA polymerase-3 subunit chi
MTSVEFHAGVTDPVGYACRLLRKAYRRGARVLVTAPDSVLAELDQALWTFDERDFVPHVRLPVEGGGADPRVVARTPIWLAARAGAAGAPAVVLNLDAAAPADLGDVERLIEIVGAEPESAERGRARWRAYRAAGLDVVHHLHGASRE